MGSADPNMARWSETLDTVDLFVSAVTVHELEIGVLLPERRDPPLGSVLRQWLERRVLPAFAPRNPAAGEPAPTGRSPALHNDK